MSDLLMTVDDYFALVKRALHDVYGFTDELLLHPEDISVNAECVMQSMNVAFGEAFRRARP